MAPCEMKSLDFVFEDGEYINQLSENSFDIGVQEANLFGGGLDRGLFDNSFAQNVASLASFSDGASMNE
jgi:hypothetical protein